MSFSETVANSFQLHLRGSHIYSLLADDSSYGTISAEEIADATTYGTDLRDTQSATCELYQYDL